MRAALAALLLAACAPAVDGPPILHMTPSTPTASMVPPPVTAPVPDLSASRREAQEAARIDNEWRAIALGALGASDRTAFIRARVEEHRLTPPMPASNVTGAARRTALADREAAIRRGTEEVNARLVSIEQRRADFDRQVAARQRDEQAAAICRARGHVAGATTPDRSILGLNAMMAGMTVENVCMRLYRETGMMPSF